MSFAVARKYQNARSACQPAWWALVDSCLAAISPWRCVLCLDPAPGMDLCPDCLLDLPWLGAACRLCALPLSERSSEVCGQCAAAARRAGGPFIDQCIAALAYDFPVDYLITGLKYRHQTVYARVLGELLSIRLHEQRAICKYELPDIVVPVPLHRWRLARRGFNQAAEIAAWLARDHPVALDEYIVRRIRNTLPQTELGGRARRNNLHNAFRVVGRVTGQRVAVIDDVLTTGTTANEIARVLKRAGAAEVQLWVVARASA
jgi:ComF family protein